MVYNDIIVLCVTVLSVIINLALMLQVLLIKGKITIILTHYIIIPKKGERTPENLNCHKTKHNPSHLQATFREITNFKRDLRAATCKIKKKPASSIILYHTILLLLTVSVISLAYTYTFSTITMLPYISDFRPPRASSLY